jgi:hypothetical protein
MVEALSIFFIVAGIALAVWWVVTDQPQKPAGFAAGALAILAGLGLLLRAQIVEFSVPDLETIDAAAARASTDADAIRDLRASVEAESRSASGRVAANAAEARRLASETSSALAKAQEQVAALNQLVARINPARPASEPDVAAAGPAATRGDLSGNPLAIVAMALRGSGSHEVTLTTSANDPEALELATRLKQAIEAGGWVVHGVNETELEPAVSGLQVIAPVPLPAYFTTLLGALGRAGLQPRGLARQRADRVEVLVGSKPRSS